MAGTGHIQAEIVAGSQIRIPADQGAVFLQGVARQACLACQGLLVVLGDTGDHPDALLAGKADGAAGVDQQVVQALDGLQLRPALLADDPVGGHAGGVVLVGSRVGAAEIGEALENVAGLRQIDVTPAIGADGVGPAIDGDGFVIAELRITGQVQVVGGCFPLRPILFITRFGAADCRNRRAGQTLVIIPALESMACIGHIVGCRKRCTCAVGVFGDIAAVDRTAVRVQGYGIGRGCPLHRQGRHISRNTAAGFVGIAIAVKPHKVTACISIGAGQTAGHGSGKCAAVFHDDLNSIGAAAQLAAVQVKGNGLQSAKAQCVRVQDFKDGAETEVDVPKRGRGVVPGAGRVVPTVRPERA